MPSLVDAGRSRDFLYLGGVEEGQQVLRQLLEEGWRPALILALEDACLAAASGGRPWKDEDWDGIPLVKVPSFQSPAAYAAIGASGCLGALAVGLSEILKGPFLKLFPLGVYGFHGSLLPELAGPAPANWAILKGLPQTGTSLLKYTEDLDGGTLVAQDTCPLSPAITVGELYTELSRRSAGIWLSHWGRIAAGQIMEAPLGRLALNLRRRPEDGRLSWDKLDADGLSRMVRALSDPYPGAYFWLAGRRVAVHRVSPADLQPTEVPRLARVDQDSLVVTLPGGALRLEDLREPGGSPLDAAALRPHLGQPMAALHQGKRVLAVVAHPDDEVLGPGGTLIRHFKNGDDVFVRIVCSGDPIRYQAGEHDQPGDALRAAYFLGAQTSGLGFPDQRLDSGSNLPLIQAIEEQVQRLRPQVVYTHFWGDVNADHVRIAEAVDVAVRPYNAPFVERVLAFETVSSSEWTLCGRGTSFRPQVYVNIEHELDRKMDAMRAYRSEIRTWPHPRSVRSLREKAAVRGAEEGFQAAEAFMLLRERR